MVLPALEPGQNLVVTSSGEVWMRINYVSIRSPDVIDDVASVIGDGRYIFQEERIVAGSCASYEKDGTCIAATAPAVSISFIGGHSILHETLKGNTESLFKTSLVSILEKGSLPSLYAGLGAVLCRNIPHSIIKLLCRGLAESTAVLFTTPFDVVKTRLQTE
ncbi:hypothetical protein GIB67_037846, partial [Kingdonia uniflora]